MTRTSWPALAAGAPDRSRALGPGARPRAAGPAAGRSRGADRAAAAASAGHLGPAAHHLPRRGQLRRGRRPRGRRQGRVRPGLAEGDFEVFEDGKPQKVAAFSLVNIPVERQARPLFAKAPIEPDVEDNLTGYDGRIYVLLLDDIQTNALRSQRTKAARARLRAALHRRQRHRRGGVHRRPLRRRAGVHQQPGPAAGRHRQVHGPQDPLGDARPARDRAVHPRNPPARRTGSRTSSTRSGR